MFEIENCIEKMNQMNESVFCKQKVQKIAEKFT